MTAVSESGHEKPNLIHAMGMSITQAACQQVAFGDSILWLQAATTCPRCIQLLELAKVRHVNKLLEERGSKDV